MSVKPATRKRAKLEPREKPAEICDAYSDFWASVEREFAQPADKALSEKEPVPGKAYQEFLDR
jgi:hypothetical protein